MREGKPTPYNFPFHAIDRLKGLGMFGRKGGVWVAQRQWQILHGPGGHAPVSNLSSLASATSYNMPAPHEDGDFGCLRGTYRSAENMGDLFLVEFDSLPGYPATEMPPSCNWISAPLRGAFGCWLEDTYFTQSTYDIAVKDGSLAAKALPHTCLLCKSPAQMLFTTVECSNQRCKNFV